MSCRATSACSPGPVALTNHLHPRFWEVARLLEHDVDGAPRAAGRQRVDVGAGHPRPVASRAEVELAGALARGYVDALAADLRRKYGWTSLDVTIAIDRGPREIHILGRFVVPKVACRLQAGLQAVTGLLASDWRVSLHASTPTRPREWRRLSAPLTRLWAGCGHTRGAHVLATEFVPADGPVRVLARIGGASLVRGVDGTTGWTTDPIGPTVARPGRTTEPINLPQAWGARTRAYLGTPYLAGGTTSAGLDCSGLVQRLYREVTGRILPRHSEDQFRMSVPLPSSTASRNGDLIFLPGEGSAASHVGLVLRSPHGPATVLHASSSHGEVVQVPVEEYLSAGRVASGLARLHRIP